MYFFYLALCPKTVNGRVTVTHSNIRFFWISLESTACEKYFFQSIFCFRQKTDEIGAFKVGKNKPSKRVKNLWPPFSGGSKYKMVPKFFLYIKPTPRSYLTNFQQNRRGSCHSLVDSIWNAPYRNINFISPVKFGNAIENNILL